jgi:hypothetical protein
MPATRSELRRERDRLQRRMRDGGLTTPERLRLDAVDDRLHRILTAMRGA